MNSKLQRVIDWLKTYAGYDILHDFRVDYTDQIPSQGAVFPQGLVGISRHEDILGNVTVENQLNFGLYYVFEKSPGDDVGAKINADWVMDFQEWVQEQSVLGLIPHFGNTEAKEIAQAQNGVLYDASDNGAATYLVTLSIRFQKKFEVNA